MRITTQPAIQQQHLAQQHSLFLAQNLFTEQLKLSEKYGYRNETSDVVASFDLFSKSWLLASSISLYEKNFMLIHELYIKCNNQLMLEFSSRSSLTHILRRSPYCNSYTPKLKGSQNSATLFQIY